MASLSLIVNSNTRYTKELEYICDVIFKTFWGLDYALNNNENNEEKIIQIQINDVKINIASILFNTDPSQWLTKNSHPKAPLRIRELRDDFPGNNFLNSSVPVIYGIALEKDNGTSKKIFDIDIFGSIFFMLTRYEEIGYDDFDLDSRGRFKERHSLAYLNQFHHRAIVNEYLDILWFMVEKASGEGYARVKRQSRIIVSHDIDFPISISNRGMMGTLKNLVGDLYVRKSPKLFFSRINAKIKSTLGLPFNDPYSTFDYLMWCAEKYKFHCTFNFIPGHEPKSLDGIQSIDHVLDTSYFHQVFRAIHQRGHYIGFHPSYVTFCDLNQTGREYRNLLSIIKKCGIEQQQIGGRQHFLRWRNPQTWQIWNELGLHYDSSVGFESTAGFRAGCCFEYPVYDLINRKKLDLLEFPLMVMDTAVLNLSSQAFTELHILDIYKICKHYGGIFTLLYHNNNVVSEIQKLKYESILSLVNDGP